MIKKLTITILTLLSIFLFAQNDSLKKKITTITSGKNATVAVSVKGIDFPFEFNNENAEKKLPMLSVFKYHIGLTALNLVDQEKLKLNQKFLIKKADLLENTYSPLRKEKPEGNFEMTLDELIYYTVSLSDNNTTDILLKIIGGTKTVQNFMDLKKVKYFQIKYNEQEMHRGWEFLYPNYTSTKSLSNLYKEFYNRKILSKKSTDYLYRILLKTTTGQNKLAEQLPKNSVAHKTGSSGKDEKGLTVAENDSGIISLKNGKHYAITVFVSDSMESEETNCKIISDISKTVFDFLNK